MAPARRLWAAALLLVSLAALALVATHVPRPGGIFPPCPFRAATGLKCPGCGSLRALHALGQGDLAAAWGYNAAMVLGLPVLGWFLANLLALSARGRGLWAPRLSRRATLAVGAALVAWGVARNLL